MTSLVCSIVVLGVITFIYRFSFISSFGRRFAERIPQEFLKLLAPSTFAAIVANSLFAESDPNLFKLKSIVALLSLLVAYLTKNIVLTLVFGMGLLYLLQTGFL